MSTPYLLDPLQDVSSRYVPEMENKPSEGYYRHPIRPGPVSDAAVGIWQPFNEIYLTPSRICVFNPGSLPYGSDPVSFASGGLQSMLRNPLIAETLYYNGSIDKFGTGFRRIFDECSREGVRYSYEDTKQGFKFFFERDKTTASGHASVLTEGEKMIVSAIEKDNGTTLRQIEIDTGLTPGVVNRLIMSMKDRRIIERVGAKKNGKWIIHYENMI